MSRDVSCDTCLNSRAVVSENGYNRICCLSEKEAVECITRKKNHYIKHPAFKEPREFVATAETTKGQSEAQATLNVFVP